MRKESGGEVIEVWLHTPSPAEQLFGAWVIGAGRARAKPEFRCGPRSIPYYSLHLVLAGAVLFTTAHTESQTLQAGDLYCLFPGVVHEYRPAPDLPLPERIWVAFDGPAAEGIPAQLGLNDDAPTITHLSLKRLNPYLRFFQASFNATPQRHPLHTTEYLTRLLGEILVQVDVNSLTDAPSGWVQRGRALLDDHFAEGITVHDAADYVGVHRSHFSKEFQRMYGTTPSSYLHRLRMNHGRALLQQSTMSITEIALSTGYADVFSFSHSYRRYFGTAPTSDRRNYTDPHE